jgi:hypothetical protein
LEHRRNIVLTSAAKRRATPACRSAYADARWRQENKSFWTIAEELNRVGIRTGRGFALVCEHGKAAINEGS